MRVMTHAMRVGTKFRQYGVEFQDAIEGENALLSTRIDYLQLKLTI